jgi:transposase
MAAAASSVGVASPAKELILKQEAALLLQIEEQMKEATRLLVRSCSDRMKKDADILMSVKGIGEMSAVSFLVEIGGDVRLYENDKKLIAAAGLDPSTYQSGKYEGASRISKRGNRHLRRLLWLMSKRVITNSPTFRTYFFKRRSEGLPYKKAMLATAHKLVRVLFALLIHERQYHEEGIQCS